MTWTLSQNGASVRGSLVGNQGLVMNAPGTVTGTLSASTPPALLTFRVNFTYPNGSCSGTFSGTAQTTSTTIQGTYSGNDCVHSFSDGRLSLTKR